jgi:hypothetical protein
MRWSLYYTFAIWAYSLEVIWRPNLNVNCKSVNILLSGQRWVMLGVNNSVTGSFLYVTKADRFLGECCHHSIGSGRDRLFTGTYTEVITVKQFTCCDSYGYTDPLPENLYNVTVSIASGGKLTASGAGNCSGSVNYPSIGLSGSQPGASGVITNYTMTVSVQFSGYCRHGAAISFGRFYPSFTQLKPNETVVSGYDRQKTITVFPCLQFPSHHHLWAPDDCGTAQFNPLYNLYPSRIRCALFSAGISEQAVILQPQLQLLLPCPVPAYGTGTQSFRLLIRC